MKKQQTALLSTVAYAGLLYSELFFEVFELEKLQICLNDVENIFRHSWQRANPRRTQTATRERD